MNCLDAQELQKADVGKKQLGFEGLYCLTSEWTNCFAEVHHPAASSRHADVAGE